MIILHKCSPQVMIQGDVCYSLQQFLQVPPPPITPTVTDCCIPFLLFLFTKLTRIKEIV